MQSKNSLIITFILFIIAISACRDHKQEIALLHRAPFNQTIIADLPAYKNLNNLIVEYMDTIINFRKAQFDHPENVIRFGFLHNNESENSFPHEDINFNNMPKYILPKLDSAFNAIKKGAISGFSITRDGMIDMSVEHTYDEKSNCDTYGSLVWNMPGNLPLIPTAKDTVLNDECRYIIQVIKRGKP